MQLILVCPALCYWYQRLLTVGWNHPLGEKGVICPAGLTVWRPLYVVQSRGFSSEIYDGAWRGGRVVRGSWWRVLKTHRPALKTIVSAFTSQLPLSPAGWCTDQLLDALPVPLPTDMFTLSAFQRNFLFQVVCALQASALRELHLTNSSRPSQQPPYSLGKHKNVILNCLEIGVRISYPRALKTNWMGLSWLVMCSVWPTSSTSAKPTSLAAHVAWFFPKKKNPSDKMVEFRIPKISTSPKGLQCHQIVLILLARKD